MTKYYAHTLNIPAQKNERSHEYIILRHTINMVQQTGYVFIQEGTPTAEIALIFDNIMFSLHLALNTCCDKGIKSFLTIPDIERKWLCGKLNSHFTHLVTTKVNLGFLSSHVVTA